ncbi:MAG: 2,3-bisphosphoglycerate-independent phosphoglycerate mutase [Pseudomonadales bacterium]|nr:2,3-bisphosphoglycerate-independent phosphoglycerate mutase [Pseudomonadales bacterium]
MSEKKTPFVLLILDGWGYREGGEDNAIACANTPVWDRLWKQRPHTLISGSGMDVGLPQGQMGNSEVGHMTLGAGRVVYQNFTRMTKAISDGSFFSNPVYCAAIDKAIVNQRKVHILGLLSPGGVHSHEDHINAMIDMAVERGAKQVYLHAFLDGRDTPPQSAAPSVLNADKKLRDAGVGRVATLCGRYYAMDRDNRWERIERAYDLLTQGLCDFQLGSATDAIEQSYQRGESDEFVLPTCIQREGEQAATVDDGDAVIFMNFRADRARELTRAFVDPSFDGFLRKKLPKLAGFVMSTEYAADLDAACAFPVESLDNTLGEYLAALGKTQLRIAETEKYAHVTFFFSGGREALYPGEKRALIPSPKVATYDLKPEMSAPELTDRLCADIRGGQYDVIICNYANGDMVGHTGVFPAAVKAAEAVDKCLGKIEQALSEVNGQCLITADHGNAERMNDDESGQPHTAHTLEPVPFIYLGNKSLRLANGGTLADVAPTLLKLLDIPQPREMTGRNLVLDA